MPKGEGIKTCTADTKDDVSKEKKNVIPLSIEDEIEKPNAKIIRADVLKAKSSTPMVIFSLPTPSFFLC